MDPGAEHNSIAPALGAGQGEDQMLTDVCGESLPPSLAGGCFPIGPSYVEERGWQGGKEGVSHLPSGNGTNILGDLIRTQLLPNFLILF